MDVLESAPKVLIVAAADDTVAVKLSAALVRNGQSVCHLDGPAAARSLTIRSEGHPSCVSPELPLFIRPSAWWFEPELAHDADARFLADESYATLWAAAALTRAPVINRPRMTGVVGPLVCRAIANLDADSSAVTREIYASGPAQLAADEQTLWGEDAELRVAAVGSLRDGVPLRARRVNPSAAYEIVTVVGERAFIATSDERSQSFELSSRSVRIARAAQVHFATLWWAIDDAGAIPSRFNPAPDASELRYAWHDVLAALCEDLVGS